jgi:hypothetical protein
VDTFWTLIEGFKRLVEEADRATTFVDSSKVGDAKVFRTWDGPSP